MPVPSKMLADADPIRRQLLDYPSKGDKLLPHIDSDSPLREWLQEHGQLVLVRNANDSVS